jgi:hypothetical protein
MSRNYGAAGVTALVVCLLSGAASPPVLALRDDSKEFGEKIQPLLAKYCYKCHGPEKKKGDLDLTVFKTQEQVLEKAAQWQRLVERVNAFEMPPEKAPQPSFEEKSLLNKWIATIPKGKQLDCDQLANDRNTRFYRGYAMSRRLNRIEYGHSVRDLLGVELHAERDVPTDGSGGEGFDNNGDALFSSPILLEKYLDAADRVLSAVLPDARLPLTPDLEASRRRLLIARPGQDLPPQDAARVILSSFARRAFRRPPTEPELGRLLTMFDRAAGRGDSFTASVRLALKAVLVSPSFLFLVEPEPEKEGVYRLGAHQLAQRLSYFLWSSIPDDELLECADSGKLLDPETARAQVRRMLRDPKSKALGESFALQWLELEPLGRTVRPDAKKFPDFDEALAEAMKDEAVLVFHDIFRKDRTLVALIDSDTTYLNNRLAKLYGIGGVDGPEMRLVHLDDRRRGGVVGMAAVLTASSFPLRTSPVVRGKWVLESLLGGKVPPPPPNAGSLPEGGGDEKKLTLRQRLEKHRTAPECAACHSRMDPLGFGLENFDPIGRWRIDDEGLPIDTAGQLPSGEKFDGVIELKKILLARKDEVMKHLARKLLGYALGRGLNKFDECVVDESVKGLKANDYRSSVLIETIALSYPFQHRYSKK